MGLTGVTHVWTAANDALLGKISDREVFQRKGAASKAIAPINTIHQPTW